MHRFPSILSSLRFNGADVRGDLEFCTNDNSVSGDVSYTSGDNEVVARVNSASSNVVESVEVTRKQASNGLNFLFREVQRRGQEPRDRDVVWTRRAESTEGG